MPVVSIVMPTYNRLTLLRATIDSILAQTMRDWELIVIDDGSTEDVAGYLRRLGDPRVTVIERSHSGMRGTLRNTGIARARARYVAFQDSDDLWDATKLEQQLADLGRKPDARWSYTYIKWVDESSQPYAPRTRFVREPAEGWIFEQLLRRSAWIAMPAVIAEKSLLDEVGGFSETLRFCHDYELWLRLSRVARVALLPAPLATVRVHSGSMWSMNVPEALTCAVQIHDGLLGDPTLQGHEALLQATRVRSLVELAAAQRGAGLHGSALRTLARALPTGLRSTDWWAAVAKTVVRPVTPAPLRRYWRSRIPTVNERGSPVRS